MTGRRTTAIGLLVFLLAQAAGVAATAGEPVSLSCAKTGKRCTALATVPFADNRGGQSAATVTLTRDGDCPTLTVAFDRPIAVDQPVRLTVEGTAGQPPLAQSFYTGAELGRLARALDDGTPLPDGPPEFTRFLDDAAAGTLDEQEPVREMLNRFAAIKESRGVALTCGPTARLLPAIRDGRAVRLEFQMAPRAITRVYHWPELDRRSVELRLGGLVAALDSSP